MRLKLKYVISQLRGKHFHIEDKKKIRKNNPHMFFYLKNENGQICTNVKTHFSVHPGQDYIDDPILKLMAEQLHIEKKKDFEDYIECSKSYYWLIDYLHKKGIKTVD